MGNPWGSIDHRTLIGRSFVRLESIGDPGVLAPDGSSALIIVVLFVLLCRLCAGRYKNDIEITGAILAAAAAAAAAAGASGAVAAAGYCDAVFLVLWGRPTSPPVA